MVMPVFALKAQEACKVLHYKSSTTTASYYVQNVFTEIGQYVSPSYFYYSRLLEWKQAEARHLQDAIILEFTIGIMMTQSDLFVWYKRD